MGLESVDILIYDFSRNISKFLPLKKVFSLILMIVHYQDKKLTSMLFPRKKDFFNYQEWVLNFIKNDTAILNHSCLPETPYLVMVCAHEREWINCQILFDSVLFRIFVPTIISKTDP